MAIDLKAFRSDEYGLVCYWTTNPWFDFSLRWLESVFNPRLTQNHVVQHDLLLPHELAEIGYAPATPHMRTWMTEFFSHQSDVTGLIESRSDFADIARYEDRADYDPELDAAVRQAHRLTMVRRMNDFLTWFPADPDLVGRCERWARGVMAHSNGHRVASTSWQLHPWVGAQSGRPVTGIPLGADIGKVDTYGELAKAFERLQPATRPWWRTGPPPYAAFAREMNWRLLHARPNPRRFLLPEKFDASGWGPSDPCLNPPPNPGLRASPDLIPLAYDTDCLYWVRWLFDAYWLAGGEIRSDLRGLVDSRARLLARLRPAPAPTRDPSLYVHMALAATTDWLRGGWYEAPGGRDIAYLVRKICFDGSRRGYTRIYGDGLWNTMYILVEAYRASGDPLYLERLSRIWDTHETLSEEVTQWELVFRNDTRGEWKECVDVQHRRGLFHPLIDGRLADGCTGAEPDAPGLVSQENFINVMLDAYAATEESGTPERAFRDKAECHATRVLNLYKEISPRVSDPPFLKVPQPLFKASAARPAMVLLKLARATSTLHTVAFRLPRRGTTLTLTTGGRTTTMRVEGDRAMVFMDEGRYRIEATAEDGHRWVRDSLTVDRSFTQESPVTLD